jgi:hypothetical protein
VYPHEHMGDRVDDKLVCTPEWRNCWNDLGLLICLGWLCKFSPFYNIGLQSLSITALCKLKIADESNYRCLYLLLLQRWPRCKSTEVKLSLAEFKKLIFYAGLPLPEVNIIGFLNLRQRTARGFSAILLAGHLSLDGKRVWLPSPFSPER